MKRLLITFLVISWMPRDLSGQETPHYSYNLLECLQYALKNNQNVQISTIKTEEARVRVNEFVADGLPQLDASVDVANNFRVPTSFIPAIIFNPEAGEGEFVPVKFGTQYNGSAMLSLNQMIFDGSFFVGIKGSKTFSELKRKELKRTEIETIELVTKAYYNVLVNEARIELIEKNYNRLDTLLRETRIMYENGFAERLAVNRIQVEFNNIKVLRKNSEDLYELSKSLLKFQMGMPISVGLELSETLSDLEFDLKALTREDFQYEDRIEYSVLQTTKALKQIEMKNTQVQYYPTLDFYTTIGGSSGTSSLGATFETDNWFGLGLYGIRFNFSIFDGLRRKSIIQQNKLQLKQIDRQFSQLKNNIDYEIQDATTRLFNNIENIKAQGDNMQLAEEIFNMAKTKYQEGVGTNLEVVDADAAYKEAQTYYYDAIFEALISKVDLEVALGKIEPANF